MQKNAYFTLFGVFSRYFWGEIWDLKNLACVGEMRNIRYAFSTTLLFQVYIFPRMTKCTFHKFGSSGEIEKHDAMCILPLNIGETPLFFNLIMIGEKQCACDGRGICIYSNLNGVAKLGLRREEKPNIVTWHSLSLSAPLLLPLSVRCSFKICFNQWDSTLNKYSLVIGPKSLNSSNQIPLFLHSALWLVRILDFLKEPRL